MRYFDTHAHIGLITEDLIDQLIVVQEARQEGVQHLVTVSNNLVDFTQLYDNLKTETQIYHSIGVSPSSVEQPGDDWEAKIIDGTKLERVVAIGEIHAVHLHIARAREVQTIGVIGERADGVIGCRRDDGHL